MNVRVHDSYTKAWIVLVVAILMLQIPVANAETFKFKSETKLEKYTATIGGELSFPPGRGPFPVIVFMHGCGGLTTLQQRTFEAHARFMAEAGFSALILDSFSRPFSTGVGAPGPQLSDSCCGPTTSLRAEIGPDAHRL